MYYTFRGIQRTFTDNMKLHNNMNKKLHAMDSRPKCRCVRIFSRKGPLGLILINNYLKVTTKSLRYWWSLVRYSTVLQFQSFSIDPTNFQFLSLHLVVNPCFGDLLLGTILGDKF